MRKDLANALRVQCKAPDRHVPVLLRLNHVTDCFDFLVRQALWLGPRTARSVVQQAARLASHPIVIASCGKAQDSKGCRQWHCLSRSLNRTEQSPLLLRIRDSKEIEPESGNSQ
jgi:hypothetical protein